MASHGLGPVGLQQLVEVIGIDSHQDQVLIQWQSVAQCLEHGAVEADQREPLQPMAPERLQSDRPVLVNRPDCGLEVRRPLLETDEAEHRQRVGHRSVVARHSFDQIGHARRVCQNQRQRTRMPRREALLYGCEAGDLGDECATVRFVGALQSEILAPVEKKIGGRVAAEDVAQPAKFRGMLLIKKDGLDVQPVE